MITYNICLISFLRANEEIPASFKLLKKELEQSHSVCSVIISEVILGDLETDILNIVISNSTKYRRIKETFNLIDAQYYVCMDSDITLDIYNALDLVNQSINKNVDISWARISVTTTKKYVEKLIDIDKILSHTLIRPLLWKLNIGITIPGQFFIFKKDSLIKAFNFRDTFLDDLAVGTYVRKNIKNLKILTTNSIVGFEIPSSNFKEILSQRKRWANGYKSMYLETKKTNLFKFVLIHGFFYHFFWIILYLVLLFAYYINYILLLFIILIILYYISNKKISKIVRSINYLLVFPLIHLWWFYSLFKK